MAEKSERAQREEKILQFWKDNKIFEKSLEKRSPKGEFVFYDGPPFATGLPHAGSLLSSVIKDVIPRYKTMRGYHVRRRWGWDCHGLPIENMIEKELGIKDKTEIESKVGIKAFNEACRASVLRYAHEWKCYVDRVGRWVEYDNAYKTMDNSYIESVWNALKTINKKGLLYEGRKVLLYCPHCETPIAKAEIAMDNSYKDVTEESVYVKFKVDGEEDTYFLVWTTTPWTLPGNTALAVNKDLEYVKIQSRNPQLISAHTESGKTTERSSITTGTYIIAKDIFWRNMIQNDSLRQEIRWLVDYYGNKEMKSDILRNMGCDNFIHKYKIEKITGEKLIKLKYKPLFEVNEIMKSDKSFVVYDGTKFVNTEEGTGIVHIAPAYGEEDYKLGLKEKLPVASLLDPSGHFNELAPELIRGQYFEKANKTIKDHLESQKLILKHKISHSYPHCHRCGTRLFYNAISSWFINIQKVKDKMIKLNEKINWVPEHLKHGRFLNIVENAPDWTISRNRYWAAPLPIWKDDSGGIYILGSLDELRKHVKKSGNKYFVMRHGEAKSNARKILDFTGDPNNHLTERGRKEVEEAETNGMEIIFTSPFLRARETSEIVKGDIVVDERLCEIGPNEDERQVRQRMREFLFEIENKYQNKKILIVSHGEPLWWLEKSSNGEEGEFDEKELLHTGEVKELKFIPYPHNDNFELDLHRPYIDEINLLTKDGQPLKRIPEVIDGWVESASMPFAEYHYPFENKKVFESRFPGDFVAEYIAQTRTWFYYMHSIATILFNDISFKNVVSTGNVLAEDGSKMSKSKGNYTDPLLLLDRIGADAFRYYLMNSVVMQSEDMLFKDEEIKEVHNRLINILWNSFNFYELYSDDTASSVKSTHILDRWIISRFYELVSEVTESMEVYDMAHATRPVRDFVGDFSTWYIRRSRARFKDENLEDKAHALSTTRYVFKELSKLIAPVMPFIAEDIYGKVRDSKDPVSVHLDKWPEGGKVDKELIATMMLVRSFVTIGLNLRSSKDIKVRQPLQSFIIKHDFSQPKYWKQYEPLLKDELNVKQIILQSDIGQNSPPADFNWEITPELEEEGRVRDAIRAIQEWRKDRGLKPGERAVLEVPEENKNLFTKYANEIKRATNTEF